jgi:two-component sensor histidine kinase
VHHSDDTRTPSWLHRQRVDHNSVKHGKGNIVVRIQTPSSNNHLISVADDGPGLPAEFCLDDGKGLGMKIIQALVKEIDGKLLVLRGEGQPGAHFAISFQSPPLECAARLKVSPGGLKGST